MEYLYLAIAIFLVTNAECVENSSFDNLNDTNKDMYVINAMVYQVGIITNSTDDLDKTSTTFIPTVYFTYRGKQEALTFYKTNGSSIDLSEIPAPLLTNITGQSLVALAPKREERSKREDEAGPKKVKSRRETIDRKMPSGHQKRGGAAFNPYANVSNFNSSLNRLNTRDTDNQATKQDLVKITSGASVIPQAAGVHSVGIPPLLTFNNNLSDIPVPIPNTSIVQYSKINTLFKPANKTQ